MTSSSVGISPTLSGRCPPDAVSGHCFDHPRLLRSGCTEGLCVLLTPSAKDAYVCSLFRRFFSFSAEIHRYCFSLINLNPTFPFNSSPRHTVGVWFWQISRGEVSEGSQWTLSCEWLKSHIVSFCSSQGGKQANKKPNQAVPGLPRNFWVPPQLYDPGQHPWFPSELIFSHVIIPALQDYCECNLYVTYSDPKGFRCTGKILKQRNFWQFP